jgi:hypothetical protein
MKAAAEWMCRWRRETRQEGSSSCRTLVDLSPYPSRPTPVMSAMSTAPPALAFTRKMPAFIVPSVSTLARIMSPTRSISEALLK